ncbi:MAG TPA: hypothetical protein VKA94_08995 [Hyphomicrobiales bacterium]|nr:hypothetical protein [Hyphomicrobiales bacterium]
MTIKNLIRCVVFPAALSFSIAGCGGGDVYYDAPALEAVGINLNAKEPDADLPERSGIVLPPSTDKLPKPGETTTASAAPAQNWPVDPEVEKKRKEEAETAAREEYCKNGKWDGGNIDEFEKNVGKEQRCQSGFFEAVNKAIGGGPADEQ